MARLQILELPEGASDDRRPFLLIIDQADDKLTDEITRWPEDIAERVGARHVLAFEATIGIPANEIPVSPDGYPLRVSIEGDFDQFRQQVQDEVTAATSAIAAQLAEARYPAERHSDQSPYQYSDGGEAAKNLPLLLRAENAETRLKYARQVLAKDGYFTADEIGDDIAPRLVEWLSHHRGKLEAEQRLSADLRERLKATSDAASDIDTKLYTHRAALTDALGMDQLRDWDDIANAAKGIRKDRDDLHGRLQAVHQLHQQAVEYGDAICAHCSNWDPKGGTGSAPAPYPCDTIKALTGYTGDDAPAPEPADD